MKELQMVRDQTFSCAK